MFIQKVSQEIDILARMHGKVFPWQQDIIGNKAFGLEQEREQQKWYALLTDQWTQQVKVSRVHD